MARALVVNIKDMNMTQGASTLTQQLIKNEVLDDPENKEKKLKRKIQEQYLAVNFEKELEKSLGSKTKAKDYILELYLNTIALNHGLNGVQAAAKYYYGKDVSELSLAESASIAGITKNPTAYSPISNPVKNKERQTLVLKKMLSLEFITQSEYDTAIAEDIYSKLVGATTDSEEGDAIHSYFVDSAIVALANQLMEEKSMSRQQAYNTIYSGGLKIYLTIDDEMQSTMENSFSKDELFPPKSSTLTASYTISIMDNATQKQNHYTREKQVTSKEEADAFAASVKEELLNSSNTFVADRLSVAKALQAAMTIMDYRTGEVKAIVGGREKNGDLVFNRATQALRQPGSCFKVLAAYAPAVDLGLVMPGTLIRDEPYTYNGWTPKNWYTTGYRGLCTVREGIKDSLNILAAKTIINVGVDTAYDYLLNFGFTTLEDSHEVDGKIYSDKVPAISLGGLTKGVTVLELTAAYGAIANGGVYNKPVFYSKVLDHDGNVIIDNSTPKSHRVLKETTAYLLTDMMKDVVTSGTGRLAKFSSVNMPIAGKTGTTSDDKDLTFAAYTPYYVAGIWMGYDIPKKMSYDKSYHLLLWKDVMEKIHSNLETKTFVKPDGIVTRNICSVSGGAPNGLCEADYFGNPVTSDIAAADAPGANKTCSVHKKVTICKDGMCLPGPNCPKDRLMDVVLAVDDDGNVINNPEEGGIDLKKVCDFNHKSEAEEPETVDPNLPEGTDPTLPGLAPTPEPEEDPVSEPDAPSDGTLPGLTGLPGLSD
ncbi:MAG: penicillin-binding transpeptidase domain-containing protein, partial [Lachnospiraceae bacterium]|nr:penicillin-binding transpeptidase domain-containing protein [Lachnospiraceae bacterium]